jgi:acyl-CoA reductase-like NAD-dependent aldehyde dehydrogenase
VWSTDEGRATKVAEQLEVGMANVNTPAGEGADLPFGGTKRSGFRRELGGEIGCCFDQIRSLSTPDNTKVRFSRG